MKRWIWHWAGSTPHPSHPGNGRHVGPQARGCCLTACLAAILLRRKLGHPHSRSLSAPSFTHLDLYSSIVFSLEIFHQIQLGFRHTFYENSISHPNFSLSWLSIGHSWIPSVSPFTLTIAYSVCTLHGESFCTVSFLATSKMCWPALGVSSAVTICLLSGGCLVFLSTHLDSRLPDFHCYPFVCL